MALGLGYVVAALSFAFFYYMMWRHSPDSFIIHQEMNLRPLSLWRKLYVRFRADSARRESVSSPTPLEEINSEYSKLTSDEIALFKERTSVESARSNAKADVKRLVDLHNAEMVNNMDTFVKEEEMKRNDGLERARADLEKKLAGAQSEADFARISKEVGDAITAAVAGSGPAKLNQFSQTSVLAGLDDAIAREDDLVKQYIDLSTRYQQVRQKQETLLESWEKQRLSRLGFFDFVYFSTGSTHYPVPSSSPRKDLSIAGAPFSRCCGFSAPLRLAGRRGSLLWRYAGMAANFTVERPAACRPQSVVFAV